MGKIGAQPPPCPNPLALVKALGRGRSTGHTANSHIHSEQKASPPLFLVLFSWWAEGAGGTHFPWRRRTSSNKGVGLGWRGRRDRVSRARARAVGLQWRRGNFPSGAHESLGPGPPPGARPSPRERECLGVIPTAWGGGLSGAAGIATGGGPPGSETGIAGRGPQPQVSRRVQSGVRDPGDPDGGPPCTSTCAEPGPR